MPKMAETDPGFADARIRFDAYVRGPEETGISVFVIEADKEQALFEVDFKFAENGNDFWVIISNFGLKGKAFAGSKTPAAQRNFSHETIVSARRRLEEYFSSSEEKKYSPFDSSKASFLGIRFSDGWAVER
jgi:hypothetical protein